MSRFAGVNSLVSFSLVLYVAEAQHSGVFPASASQKEGVSLIPAIAVHEPFFFIFLVRRDLPARCIVKKVIYIVQNLFAQKRC